MQSLHENYLNLCWQHKKVISHEDDDYIYPTRQSNMGCKKFDHISRAYFLLVANNKTIHSPTSRHCDFYLLKFFKNFVSRRAERASNLTFSKCLHLVDLNNPRILMTRGKMAALSSAEVL